MNLDPIRQAYDEIGTRIADLTAARSTLAGLLGLTDASEADTKPAKKAGRQAGRQAGRRGNR
jgi:hypothetical protein